MENEQCNSLPIVLEGDVDFVIVGAGSAGCVLAGRLSALPNSPTVCLIERGPPNVDERWQVAMPAAISNLYNPNINRHTDLWLPYLTTPESRLGDRRLNCRRGCGWGGSSAVNAMQYVRGQPQDFDRWATAEFCGKQWSFEHCLPFFKTLETYTPGFSSKVAIDPDAEEECRKTIHRFRGLEGPVGISSGRELNRKYSQCPIFPAFIRAGVQAGHKYNPNYNGADQEGVGWLDINVANGCRQSASRCYLLPALSRPNLRIISEALVSRVILEEKRATGVEFIDSDGRRHIVRANKEVILSAGTYNTPQILMLSGIGEALQLRKMGIEQLHDLPGVGGNLQEHLLLSIEHFARRPDLCFSPGDWKTPEWIPQLVDQWENSKTGKGCSTMIESCLFFKTFPSLATSNIECVLSTNTSSFENTAGGFVLNAGISLHILNARPQSVGRVTLRSNDPGDSPIIEHNFLQYSIELEELIEAIKIVRKVLSQPALSEYIGEEKAPGMKCSSDAALEQYVRAVATSCGHPCGTCRMGDPNAAPMTEEARQLVVDSELRVCGLRGLRVVDASIMPSIISGNLNAPTMMIAERAVAFIEATCST